MPIPNLKYNIRISRLLLPKTRLIITKAQFPKNQFTLSKSIISEGKLKFNLRSIIRHFSFHKTNNISGILKLSWLINHFIIRPLCFLVFYTLRALKLNSKYMLFKQLPILKIHKTLLITHKIFKVSFALGPPSNTKMHSNLIS